MSYIVQRQDRFYVVAHDGLDPLTGRERRRWHPVGHDRDEAEQLAARLDRERDATPAAPTGPITFGEFLTNTWIPHKGRQVRATTAYRYAWFVDRNVARDARTRRRPPVSDVARSWTAAELSAFLAAARGQRLYPALHLAAHAPRRDRWAQMVRRDGG